MDNSLHILSIMEDILGHTSYGLNMRKYFNEVSSCKNNIDFYWFKEEREFLTKILMRPLHTVFPNQWIRKQNLDFHRFRCQTALACTARRLTTRKLKQKFYSVLHLHTQTMGLYSSDLMKKIPTVVGLDLTSVQVSEEFADPIFRWTYKPNILLEKNVFEAAARIVTWSDFARKSVISDFNIDDAKVIRIYPGVDIGKISLPNSSVKSRNLTYKILFMGGDFRRKGGEDLLEVFLKSFKDVAELHIVTQFPIKCDHPNVHIYNDVRAYTPQWMELYHQADLFVMPSYAEAFGLAFIEAMAAGLPVIATQINAIPEIVRHGETGFLINSGDRQALAQKIQFLIDNPSLRIKMGEKGREIVEQKFDSNKNFQALESTFREVASSH